jgi:CRISPR-associated protein Cas2
MVRNRYFVCYDVADPLRLAHTYKAMKGYGERVQYSVFVCDLNDKEMIIMKEDLQNILNLSEDRVLMIDTGPANKHNDRIFTMGMSLEEKRESAIVI